MKDVKLVALALRVLSACTKGRDPDQDEVELLRQPALPGEARLSIGVLACAIVRRETERELAVSRKARPPMKAYSGL